LDCCTVCERGSFFVISHSHSTDPQARFGRTSEQSQDHSFHVTDDIAVKPETLQAIDDTRQTFLRLSMSQV
jgi:hypothetical protein